MAAIVEARNAELNGVSFFILTSDGVNLDLTVDVILAGDVCYEREAAERTLSWLRQQTCSVLIADPGRHYAPTDGLDLVQVYNVPVLRELESVDVKRTRLWRLLA